MVIAFSVDGNCISVDSNCISIVEPLNKEHSVIFNCVSPDPRYLMSA